MSASGTEAHEGLYRSFLALPVRQRLVWSLALAMFIAVGALWMATAPPLVPGYRAVRTAWQPSEAWLYDRSGQLIDSQRVDFHARRLDWVPLDQVTKALPTQLIASEDRRFADHGGVDWLAVGAAIQARLTGETSRGASTLSMQLAAYLTPDLARPGARGWRDKMRQMRAAMALESRWTKDQILEAYLNLAPFRGEAQGIGAAALGLFGKTPDALSPQDAALLVALLPDPSASAEAIARRACRIAPRDCPQFRTASVEMVASRRSLALDPGLAPHLAAKLLNTAGVRQDTTLDRQVQSIAAIALRRQMQQLGRDRARDGAAIVVDNETGDVLAYVGGVAGDSTAAFVDGASAPRQAGSTLKPFLYAQVLERGYLTPASILDDSPVQLDTASGLYVPQNYDKGFKGPVSVRTALASSLNVPAVRTLLIAGPDQFRDRLWDTGFHGLTEDGDYYGFSLALGSAEVTLLEQAAAYRSFALGGRWSPLRIKASDPRIAPRRILSEQAAWLVGDILSDPVARSTTFGISSALKLPFWAAAKTGTSKAMRDNWCIGWSDRFTVAVWVGNLEGDSMRAVSGTSGAAPVWRDIMLALHHDRPGRQPAMPAGIERRNVRFADNFEQTRTDYFRAGTGQSVSAMAPLEARRARITNPVSGSIYALDPDIPFARQRLGVAVNGATPGHRLILDKRDIGAADSRPLINAAPGAHRLALVDISGKTVDKVLFTVR